MTEINPPGWLQNLTTHTAEQMRSYLGGFLAVPQGAASLKTANAVHPGLGGALAVTQNGTPNMSVNVAAGLAFIAGTEATKQGTYIVQNDATVNKAITASDATLNRIDLIVAKVQDAAYSGATNSWSLAVVAGTPASSPSAPTAPANSITLAQVAINAGVTSITTGNITDKRPYNAALGGIVPCTSAVRPSNPYSGLYAYETDTFRTVRYNGTNWHQLGRHVCTSSTRPSGPFTGMEIYETDTNLTYTWNGTKWMRSPTTIYKTSSENRTSTTTLATDSTLFWTAEANATYTFDAALFIFGDAVVDMKAGMTIPSGASIAWTISPSQTSGVAAAAGDTTTWHKSTTLADPSWTIGLLTNPDHNVARLWGSVAVGATPGTVGFAWAQGVSNGTFASWVELGSWLTYRQVA